MEKKTIRKVFGIVIADRGWVYVGDIEDDGIECTITNCNVIRRWGTKRGLGQLAVEGPQEHTKLDPYGTVIVPNHAKISIVVSEKTLWEK